MANRHKDTETQRHREKPPSTIFSTGFLCVVVFLCLCMTTYAQLFPKARRDTGPKPKNIHGVVQTSGAGRYQAPAYS